MGGGVCMYLLAARDIFAIKLWCGTHKCRSPCSQIAVELSRFVFRTLGWCLVKQTGGKLRQRSRRKTRTEDGMSSALLSRSCRCNLRGSSTSNMNASDVAFKHYRCLLGATLQRQHFLLLFFAVLRPTPSHFKRGKKTDKSEMIVFKDIKVTHRRSFLER